MTWWTGAALGLDFESDSPEPTEARIITGAMVLVTPGNVPQPMELMIQPERDIPQGAIDLHGITTERAMEEGVLREVGIAQIAATIGELACLEIPLVGHNISYDLTLLDRELRRLGIGMMTDGEGPAPGGPTVIWIGGKVVTRFYVIDTMVIDKTVDRYRPGKRKLAVTAEHYGVPMAEGSAHGATADVVASLRIAITIAKRCAMANGEGRDGYDMQLCNQVMEIYRDRKRPNEVAKSFAQVGRLTLPELHAAQVRWAREQAEGLREHFVKNPDKGDPDTVDGSWPLRTLTAAAVETVSTTLV
jgi:DNA polymerase-3 subunit epsilon